MNRASQQRTAKVVELAVELEGWLRRRWRSGGATQAAAELVRTFDALDDFELIALDAGARKYLSRLPTRRDLGRDPQVRAALVRLGALARSGYTREAALRALAENETFEAIAPLALLRATDWVPEVRREALRIVERLDPTTLVAHLPLAEHLARKRDRGDSLAETLVARLVEPGAEPALRAGRQHLDRRVRRSCWRRLLAGDQPSPADLGEALADDDVVVRNLAAARIPELEPGEQALLATRLRRDPVGQLRARGLGLQVDLGVAGRPELLAALRDRSGAVRSRAAFHWRRLGEDPADVYRDGLAHLSRIDIIGLGECGVIGDVARLEKALRADDHRIRAKAVRAMARLDPSAGERVERFLDDESTSVADAALAGLRRCRLDTSTLQRCAERAVDDGRSGVRQSMLPLLRPSTWTHLAMTLKLVCDPDRDVRAIAEREMRTWLRRSAHVSKGPTPVLRGQIGAGLGRLDPASRREVEFILRTSR